MKALLLLPLAALTLAGCTTASQIDPRTAAAVFCVLSADGVVIAQATTKGGAQATSQKLGAAQPVACDSATRLRAAFAPSTK